MLESAEYTGQLAWHMYQWARKTFSNEVEGESQHLKLSS